MKYDLADSSLCQIAGISSSVEIELNRQGIKSPAQLGKYAEMFFSKSKKQKINASVARYAKFRKLELVDAIVNSFPCGHRVRILYDLFEYAMFLDIETDGIGPSAGITCVSTLMNGKLRTFVYGRDLDDFLDEWANAKVLVTYNGKRFDVPIIQKTFGLTCVPAHIDMMDESRHYGFKGGLKEIERKVGYQTQLAEKLKKLKTGEY